MALSGSEPIEPLDRADAIAGLSLDPLRCLEQGFDDRRHVMSVGVQQHDAIDHDADVPLPEDEVAPLQPVIGQLRDIAAEIDDAAAVFLRDRVER